ncbi:unnamed protein product [Pseudo-nitzschia multistriata]|uniref:Uncharacterized protein n=1 Tax=Pseudo-nitzschia multistriata TaxID=183589 RepID=A0A448ZBE9_9STRA|nr:unnamed protein product [Pseudo-nitzschia multistriata]
MQPNVNGTTGTKSREANMESQRGRNFTIPQPIAEEDQQQQSEKTSVRKNLEKASFMDSVKKFFEPCVGAVDAASFYIGECRPSDYEACDPNQQDKVAEDVIMKLRERNGGLKRRNETLEIPTNGMLFEDDDVSAISSHTLEEMERLRLAQNSGITNFQIAPGKHQPGNILHPRPTDDPTSPQDAADRSDAVKFRNWSTQKTPSTAKPQERGTNEGNITLCVSVSDSSSNEDGEKASPKASSPKEFSPKTFTSPPSWSKKSGKNRAFKTHPVG